MKTNPNFHWLTQGIPEGDVDCLLYYSREWSNYRWSTTVLNNVCRYLNEQKYKRDSNAETIEMASCKIWREELFNSLIEKVSNAALKMLERNRSGESMNTDPIKNVIQSYIDLGFLEEGQNPDAKCTEKNLSVNHWFFAHNSIGIFLTHSILSIQFQFYKTIEQRVLNDTTDHYNIDGESAMLKFYVEQKSFVEYMKYIHTRLNDERDRTKLFHPTTKKPLMEICYKILIEKRLDIFDAEFRVSISF